MLLWISSFNSSPQKPRSRLSAAALNDERRLSNATLGHRRRSSSPSYNYIICHPQSQAIMSSAKSFALKALRCNITGQRLSRNISGQFQNGLVKAQAHQRAFRPAFVPVRWHSIPASARSKDYDFSQMKEFSSSPSKERLLIGKSILPTQQRSHCNTLTHPELQTSVNPPNTKQVLFPARSTSP